MNSDGCFWSLLTGTTAAQFPNDYIGGVNVAANSVLHQCSWAQIVGYEVLAVGGAGSTFGFVAANGIAISGLGSFDTTKLGAVYFGDDEDGLRFYRTSGTGSNSNLGGKLSDAAASVVFYWRKLA